MTLKTCTVGLMLYFTPHPTSAWAQFPEQNSLPLEAVVMLKFHQDWYNNDVKDQQRN